MRNLLAQARTEKTICDDGSQSLEELAGQGQCYALEQNGVIVGGYVLKVRGSEVWVLLAGGRADVDLTDIGLRAIEQQAQAFETVGFQTKRRGLVRKAQRQGYEIQGYILRKKL